MRKLLWNKASHNTFEWLPKIKTNTLIIANPLLQTAPGFSELADDERYWDWWIHHSKRWDTLSKKLSFLFGVFYGALSFWKPAQHMRASSTPEEPLVTVYPSIRQQSSLHHLHELSISTAPLTSDLNDLAQKKTCRILGDSEKPCFA